MQLSVHAVITPDARVAGVLAFDEEGFDYVPVCGDVRGVAFAGHLREGLIGTAPGRLLAYYFDQGGPHLYESLSEPEAAHAPTRLAAIYERAGAEGWNLDASQAASTSGPQKVPPTTPEEPELPRSLRQAMALTTLSALHRRNHRAIDLRLYEMHPAGGMYDGYTLLAGPRFRSLCFFNLEGTSLLLHPLGRPRPPVPASDEWLEELWRYPTAFLEAGSAEELALRLEDRLGLTPPQGLPSPSPSSITLATMAEFARRYALSSRAPQFRSGCLDTSAWVTSPVRPWVSRFPAVSAVCGSDSAGPTQGFPANRLWGIDSEGRAAEDPRVVVDLATGRVYGQGGGAGSLWDRYRQGEGIRSLAWWLETLWRS